MERRGLTHNSTGFQETRNDSDKKGGKECSGVNGFAGDEIFGGDEAKEEEAE